MKFTDLVDPRELTRGIDQKLITIREHHDGALIYNYSDAALYTPGAWENPAVRQCRGLVVRDGDVVARPWAKFFNHGQREAGHLDLSSPVEVTDKMDGSLGILYPQRDGQLAIATRGSFVSDQAVHATNTLRRRYSTIETPPGLTMLFEIIYPKNRIVCDYGDTDDLVLLGASASGRASTTAPLTRLLCPVGRVQSPKPSTTERWRKPWRLSLAAAPKVCASDTSTSRGS